MNHHDETATELTVDECWQALRGEQLARLAYLLGDEINLVPINYAVDDDRLLFRSAEGDKLLAVVMHAQVVLEIDQVHGDSATSVVVRGEARKLEEDEAHRADQIGLQSWTGAPKYNVVEIRPTALTGRTFTVDRPRHAD